MDNNILPDPTHACMGKGGIGWYSHKGLSPNSCTKNIATMQKNANANIREHSSLDRVYS